jgi:hypothetical protein
VGQSGWKDHSAAALFKPLGQSRQDRATYRPRQPLDHWPDAGPSPPMGLEGSGHPRAGQPWEPDAGTSACSGGARPTTLGSQFEARHSHLNARAATELAMGIQMVTQKRLLSTVLRSHATSITGRVRASLRGWHGVNSRLATQVQFLRIGIDSTSSILTLDSISRLHYLQIRPSVLAYAQSRSAGSTSLRRVACRPLNPTP